MPHVVDSENKAGLARAEILEAEHAKKVAELNKIKEKALKDAEYCFHPSQAGPVIYTKDFEDKLRKLIPPSQFVKFLTYPNLKGDLKRAIFVNVRGEVVTIAYEPEVLAERSVRRAIPRKIVDPSYLIAPGTKPNVITELPKPAERKPTVIRTDTLEVLSWGETLWDAETQLPGFHYFYEPGGEITRGYGTVLSALVALGVITPTQVEKTFGAPESALYAKALGKGVN